MHVLILFSSATAALFQQLRNKVKLCMIMNSMWNYNFSCSLRFEVQQKMFENEKHLCPILFFCLCFLCFTQTVHSVFVLRSCLSPVRTNFITMWSFLKSTWFAVVYLSAKSTRAFTFETTCFCTPEKLTNQVRNAICFTSYMVHSGHCKFHLWNHVIGYCIFQCGLYLLVAFGTSKSGFKLQRYIAF